MPGPFQKIIFTTPKAISDDDKKKLEKIGVLVIETEASANILITEMR